MSQFDKISFASQIFWFCSFFLVSYFLLLRYVLSRIYTVLKVREKTLVQLEYEVKHTDNIVKIWSSVVNLGIYKGVLVAISDFLNVFVARKSLYVELSKILMEASLSVKNSSSNIFVGKMVDILSRQRLVNSLGEKKK